MNARRLLIDAGNSRLKWVVVENRQWHDQGVADYADMSPLMETLIPGTDCVIASVASAQQENRIKTVLGARGIAPTWLVSGAVFADVTNTYLHPEQLGVDRWMGLIAARERIRAPALVVSVGTAMTVDALSAEGTFLGGLIVPGVAMMRQALQQGTARVMEVAGTWTAFPRTTEDAVHSGIIAALCGAIHKQHIQLAETAEVTPCCFMTGGDADMLLPHLTVSVEHVPALVLEGIDRVARRGGAG
ncbi:MAG: type III pantothenate kinase [Thiobacillus sp.]